MTKYSVRTFIDYDTGLIRAETWYEAIDRHQLMATRIIQTEDRAVRDALIALGWKPPEKDWERPRATDTPAPAPDASRGTSPGKGAIPPRPFLAPAMAELAQEMGKKLNENMKDALKRHGPFPNEATIFPGAKPLKVHMYFDQKLATYSVYGKTHRFANTVCKANSEVKHITSDFRDVTCKTCRRKWKRMTRDG